MTMVPGGRDPLGGAIEHRACRVGCGMVGTRAEPGRAVVIGAVRSGHVRCGRAPAVAAITGVRSGKGGIVPRMTIRTSPGRTLTPVAPRRTETDPLVVHPGTIAPGRARSAAPLRREGPAKL